MYIHIFGQETGMFTANLRTKIKDVRGPDSSVILILRVAILMCLGSFLESLSQRILAGILLVGRLGAQNIIPTPQGKVKRCMGFWPPIGDSSLGNLFPTGHQSETKNSLVIYI